MRISKKNLIIIAIAIFSFFLLAVNCSKKNKTEEKSFVNYGLLNYISDDALFIFKIKDLSKTYAEFQNSDFYYNLMKYEIVQSAEKYLDAQDYSQIEKNYGFKPSLKLLIDLIGKDSICSISMNDALPVVKFILQYDDTIKPIIEKIDRKFTPDQNDKELTVSITDYKKIKIKSVKILIPDLVANIDKTRNIKTETSLHYFFDNNILCLSNDLAAVQKTIDLMANDSKNVKPIVSDKLFMQTFANLDLSSQTIVYFKMKEIGEVLKKSLANYNIKDIDKIFKSWDLINATGSTFDIKQKTIIKTYNVFNHETENQKMLKLMQKKATNLQTPNLIPINALLYISTNVIDAKLLFENYRETFDAKTNKEIDAFLKTFKQNVKLDFVDDLLGNLGGEVSFAMFDINLSLNPMDALNSLALYSEVKDKEKMNKAMSASLKYAAPNIKLEKEKYKNTEVFKIVDTKQPFKKNSLSYAYQDNIIVLSTYDTLKKIIDTREKEERSIIAQKKLEEIKDRLKDSNSFLFFDFREFVKNVKNICDALTIFFDPQDKYYSLYAVPIFDMLSYIDTISGFSKNDNNGVYSEMYIFMSTPERLARKNKEKKENNAPAN